MAGDKQTTLFGGFAADFAVDHLANLCEPIDGVQTGPFGSQLHKEDYVAVGTPIITVEHLGENRIQHDDIPRVADEDRERLSKYSLRKGDIVFSRVGSVDRRALVRDSEDGWLFSGRCLRVRPNENKINSEYLSYFFGMPAFKEYIRAIAVGATMPSLNTKLLSDILIPHPQDVGEQDAIARILGTLDDKIELNRKMNETLEAMAKALFKSWFVDFAPVRAKMEGRWKRGRSLPGLPAHIFDLFPDKLVDSELGEIPEGWVVSNLGDLLELEYGKALKAEDRQQGDIPVYGSNGQVGWHDVRLFPGPGIVVGRKGNPGIVKWVQSDFFVIDTAFYVIPKENCNSLHFLYHALKSHNLASVGADSAVPGLNRNMAYMSKQVLPSRQLLKRFDAYTSEFIRRAHHCSEESRTLAAQRDIMLPLLMSGKVRLIKGRRFPGETD